ncbi:MAG: protein kinase, partial [Rickettsiales bacterium]|nr:protein kinase [Rickettsiales bacterium]
MYEEIKLLSEGEILSLRIKLEGCELFSKIGTSTRFFTVDNCPVVKIGCGAYGDIYKVYSEKLGKYVAVKVFREENSAEIFKKTQGDFEYADVFRAQKYKSRALPEIFSSKEVELEKRILIMEYCECGDLLDYLNSRTNSRTRKNNLKQQFPAIIRLLRDMHDSLLMHRDIKPENILIRKDGSWVLSDFGSLARDNLHEIDKDDMYGTLKYMPPEVALKGAYYSTMGDIWSLGIVMYMVLTDKNPVESLFFETFGCNDINALSVKKFELGMKVILQRPDDWNKRILENLKGRHKVDEFFMEIIPKM